MQYIVTKISSTMFFGVHGYSLKGASFATGVLCVHHASYRNAWWDVLTPQPGMDNLGPPPSCHTRVLIVEVHFRSLSCPLLTFASSPFPLFLPAASSRFHSIRPPSGVAPCVFPVLGCNLFRNFSRSCWTTCAPAPWLLWSGKGRTSSPGGVR